jgi:hypothetical protein
MSKGDKIEEGKPAEGEAVLTTTEEVPHEADASSQPGPYDGLEVNRPPVSTNDPEVPIAQSLVAGAGAPTPEPEIHPETHVADNAYVSSKDKDNMGPKPEKADK